MPSQPPAWASPKTPSHTPSRPWPDRHMAVGPCDSLRAAVGKRDLAVGHGRRDHRAHQASDVVRCHSGGSSAASARPASAARAMSSTMTWCFYGDPRGASSPARTSSVDSCAESRRQHRCRRLELAAIATRRAEHGVGPKHHSSGAGLAVSRLSEPSTWTSRCGNAITTSLAAKRSLIS